MNWRFPCIALLAVSQLGFCYAELDTDCPIGFTNATDQEGNSICYFLKEAETFDDLFIECEGNLFTSKLLSKFNITIKIPVWTDYKTIYPGGPFNNWLYNEKLEFTEYVQTFNASLDINEDMCLVIDTAKKYIAVRCNEKYRRYCMVNPYSTYMSVNNPASYCGKFDYIELQGPKYTCLKSITGVKLNGSEAMTKCRNFQGILLQKGWRHAIGVSNNTLQWSVPLGVVVSPDKNLYWLNTEGNIDTKIDNGRSFLVDDLFLSGHASTSLRIFLNYEYLRTRFYRPYLGINDRVWNWTTNGNFDMVICEKPIVNKNTELLIERKDNKIYISSELSENDELKCFTDAYSKMPVKISNFEKDSKIFKVVKDGYYWCKKKNYREIRESNRVYFNKSIVDANYSIKLYLPENDKYNFLYHENIEKKFEKKLQIYIYAYNMYVKQHGVKQLTISDKETVEKRLKEYYNSLSHSHSDEEYEDTMKGIIVKRLYLDRRTVLVHATLSSKMLPPPQGRWEGLNITQMRPIHRCDNNTEIPFIGRLEESKIFKNRNYTCIGDHIEGLQWVVTSSKTKKDNVDIGVTETSENTIHLWKDFEAASTSIKEEDYGPSNLPFKPTHSPLDTIIIEEVITVNYPTETVIVVNSMPTNDPNTEVTSPYEVTTETMLATTETLVATTETVLATTEAVLTTTETVLAEQFEEMLTNLEELLNNTMSVPMESIEGTIEQVDPFLMETENEFEFQRLLRMLDVLASRADLHGNTNITTVRDNIALVSANVAPDTPVTGLTVEVRDSELFEKNAFNLVTDPSTSDEKFTSDQYEAVVILPKSLTASTHRVSFVVFRTDVAFKSVQQPDYQINSRVISVTVENGTEFLKDETIDIHLQPLNATIKRTMQRTCMFYNLSNDQGTWSSDGCELILSNEAGVLDICRCTHLTHFAEILIPRTTFSIENESALEVISMTGCFLSLFGLLIVGLTAVTFRSWRREYVNKIWLQLCVSEFLLAICFLIAAFVKFDQYSLPCMLIGVVLHYSVLSSYCWMLIAAIISYRRLVLVFTRDCSHKLLKACVFSWGIPFAVLGILLAVSPQAYNRPFDETLLNPNGGFCYPSGANLWWSVYAPIVILLIINWTLFILIVRSVFCTKRISSSRDSNTNETLRCASVSCLLVFLFGLPWLFGIFSFNLVASYLFAFTASYQGFVLFIFFVVGNKKTRELWLDKLKIKQTSKIPVTSSTYTNKNGHSHNSSASIEVHALQPRSLAAKGESRFL